MKTFAITCLAVSVVAGMAPNFASAGVFRRGRANAQPAAQSAVKSENRNVAVSGDTSTAQGVALLIVQTGRFRHWGGNTSFEGIGMGPTPEAAEAACCFRSRMIPREKGFARMANGMWVCCCRY